MKSSYKKWTCETEFSAIILPPPPSAQIVSVVSPEKLYVVRQTGTLGVHSHFMVYCGLGAGLFSCCATGQTQEHAEAACVESTGVGICG